MSGEEESWLEEGGRRVGVRSFRTRRGQLAKSEAKRRPRASVILGSQAVMRVEVTHDERVIVGLVEDRGNVRAMAWRAGSSWWHIDVEERDVGLVDLCLDSLEFDERVVVEGDVDGGEGNGVVYEERHTSPSTPLAVLEDEIVARERRDARLVLEFGFLEADDVGGVLGGEGGEGGGVVFEEGA